MWRGHTEEVRRKGSICIGGQRRATLKGQQGEERLLEMAPEEIVCFGNWKVLLVSFRITLSFYRCGK